MSWQNPSDGVIAELLKSSKVIAVVGCSPDPSRTSHQIAALMQQRGYRIIPVNPVEKGPILGETVYADLKSIPADIHIDIVNVFRRSETTVPVAQDAVARGTRALWLQQGVVNEEAYRIGKAAGLVVVMDLCIAVMHSMLVKPRS